jgi:hypothetical protein
MKNYKRVYCQSGFNMSIQASETSYCDPKDNAGPYTHVEIGFPNAIEEMIIGFAEDPDNPTETVYGWVPVGLVQALIIKHGGIEEGEHPVFDIDVEQSFELAKALSENSEKE